MRRLVLIEFLTVDGVLQGLGSPEEDTSGGFRHGGWGAPYAAAIHEAVVADGPPRTSAYLFGRRTYEKMAAFWSHQPDEDLTDLTWDGAEVLTGPREPTVHDLKQDGGGDIAVLGSGQLAQQLMSCGLIDELRLFVHPLLLGTGRRLLTDLPTPQQLQPTSCRTSGLGTVVLGYDVRPG